MHRLTVYLAHARLADVQYLAYFTQVQFFIVVKGEHQRFPLRQAAAKNGRVRPSEDLMLYSPSRPLHRRLAHLALAAFALAPLAHAAPPAPRTLEEADAQRARASEIRNQAEKNLAAEQAACYQKFLVNSCLEDAKKKYTNTVIEARQLDQPARDFQREHQVGYPLLIAEPSVVQLTESLGNAAQGLPFTVIVDKTGVISRVKVGMLSEDDLDTTLGRLTRP